jgi:hypothetical protein
MRKISKIGSVVRFVVAAAMVPVMMVQPSLAWGGDGRRMINRMMNSGIGVTAHPAGVSIAL